MNDAYVRALAGTLAPVGETSDANAQALAGTLAPVGETGFKKVG